MTPIKTAHHPSFKTTPVLVAILYVISALAARASQIWDGPFITFAKSTYTDWMQPTNQDHITPAVWLTRDTTHGLFNAARETNYTHYLSPTNTEWAYGQITDYASLVYTNWEGWDGRQPSSMVGKDAVLHLLSEDIYLAIHFLSWDQSGGGFSYQRSTPLDFKSITVADGLIILTWDAVIGQSYVVEYSDDLTSSDGWLPCFVDTASEPIMTVIDYFLPDAPRFYRLVLLP